MAVTAFTELALDRGLVLTRQPQEGVMATKVDGAGHRYVEFEMSKDEQIRVTCIP